MQIRPARHLAITAVASVLVGCASQIPQSDPQAEAARAIGLQSGLAIVLQGELPDDSSDELLKGASGSAVALSLVEVIQLTAQNNAEIQAAMARVRIAQADAKQSRLLPNPVVSLALRFPENGSTIIDAGLSADLIAILKQPGAINAADARLRVASAEAITAVLDEITASQEHYFSIQSLEGSIAVLSERRELINRLLKLAESKLRIGEGTRLDVVTLQTQSVELETEIAESELQLRDEQLALAQRIGQPSSDANWSVPKWEARDQQTVDEQSSICLALAHRPEIQQRQWELAAFGYEQKLSDWNLLSGTEVGVAAERDGDWSIGPSASLPLPLFDMGQAQRQRAIATVIESRHQLTSARRQVISEVRRACTTVAASNRNLSRVRDELLPLQELRLKQAEAQFRAGQTDITGLLIAEQDLRASRAQLIELQRKVAIAQVRLERAVGGAGVLANATTQPTLPPTTQRTP